MATTQVLIEILGPGTAAVSTEVFSNFESARQSTREAERQNERLAASVSGIGVDFDPAFAPVPMFSSKSLSPADALQPQRSQFEALPRRQAAPSPRTPLHAVSHVLTAEVRTSEVSRLRERTDLKIWPSSELSLYNSSIAEAMPSPAVGGTDCRPFRPGVSIETIREQLSVSTVWADGFRGQNVVVAIIDEGVNGQTYPVIGGFSRPGSGQMPGQADITSHGSMCAADVLIAAPQARLYDYPFIGNPRSGGALQMFQAILSQRRQDGTPHFTNNSYGFVGVPSLADFPDHEVHNIDHPVHRKVREVVAVGVACFFAAGNCGEPCPSSRCHPSGIGPRKSIHGSNSLAEVITVAAVNAAHDRIGYSSQGPGMFHTAKPDISCYSHIFGNFGPDRPGGLAQPFDNGTSAATPVAAGVGALLLSAFNQLTPEQLKQVLIDTSIDLGPLVGRDDSFGFGVINAGAAYSILKRRMPPIA